MVRLITKFQKLFFKNVEILSINILFMIQSLYIEYIKSLGYLSCASKIDKLDLTANRSAVP